VKTGATISYGGATQRFGVQPDMICLAKAICGGYPGGAIGMTAELGEVVASDRVHQIGTFNGNPLVMAAAEATLTKVLTPDVYDKLEETNDALKARCTEVIDEYGLPAYAQGLGAKGCVIFAPEPIYEYRDYLTKVDGELATLVRGVRLGRLRHVGGSVGRVLDDPPDQVQRQQHQDDDDEDGDD
jgi:glutamate-1-semialdehyde 2,1-aminomutase